MGLLLILVHLYKILTEFINNLKFLIMKKSYLILATFGLYLSAWGQQPNDFKVGELYYSIISEEEKTVAVENGDKRMNHLLLDMPSFNSPVSQASDIDNDSEDDEEYGYNFETYMGNYCKGDIVVPSTIEYQGTTYTVTQLADGAFSYCRDVTSVTMPETLQYIGPGAFYLCGSLEEVIIPDSVEDVGEWAFRRCYNLVKVHWPSSASKINELAFANVGSNHRFDEPDGPYFMLENGENITHVAISGFWGAYMREFPYWDNLVEIGINSFNGTQLTFVKIPEGCSVGKDAFLSNRKLQTIELPKDCRDNISEVFIGSENVQLIRIAATVPPVLSRDWAAKVAENCVLEVPDESLELYRNAEYWKNFSEIITSGVETVEASRFSAIGLSGSLRVNSVKEATVFDMQGTRLHTGLDFELQLPAGIYIVKSGETERKVQVK